MTVAELVSQWLGNQQERSLSVKQTQWLSGLVIREGVGTSLDVTRRQYFHIGSNHYFLAVRPNGSSILRPHTEGAK